MFFRRFCCLWLFLLLCLPISAWAALAEIPELSSIAYIVYDGDFNYPILEKNSHQKRSIASLTKVMTLVCVADLIEAGKLQLDTKITASAKAASRDGTQIKLKAGDSFTLEELLYATALVSANDAAVALAEHIAGSEAAFTKIMNEKAQELGLENTHFTDCTGLLSIFSNNYSTAYDQARLLQIALEFELLRKILATQEYFLKAQNRKIVNTHPLLGLPGVEGGKTGATTPAGHTLVTSTMRHERRIITVVLGARSREVRNAENRQLMEWSFENLRVLISTDQVVTPVLIPDGVIHQVNGVLAREFSLVAVSPDDLEFTSKVELSSNLRAPVESGDKIGELVIFTGEKEFSRIDLVSQQSTGLATWLRRIFNRLFHLLGMGR